VKDDVLNKLKADNHFSTEFSNGATLEVFGSSRAELATPSSDVDLCLRLPRHKTKAAALLNEHNEVGAGGESPTTSDLISSSSTPTSKLPFLSPQVRQARLEFEIAHPETLTILEKQVIPPAHRP